MSNIVGQLVPLAGIVFAVGLPLSIPIVFMVLNYRKRRRLMELHHAERMAAIERGMEIPPLPMELIDGGSPRRRRTSLLPGLVWLFVGLAVLISMRTLAEEEALLGLIPTGIGLAYLIYYFVEGRKIEARLLENDLNERAGNRQLDGPSRSL
jgi:hypothetical protein